MEIEKKIMMELRKGPASWQRLVLLFPRKHPEAVEREIYSLSRRGMIFPVRAGVFKEVTPDMSEEDYIDLTHRYDGIDNESLKQHGLKRCSECKHVKPFEDYYVQKRDHNGYRPDCKECVKARIAARREGQKAEKAKKKERIVTERKPTEPSTRQCRCCGQEKSITQFYLQKAVEWVNSQGVYVSRAAYRRSHCRTCNSAKRKELHVRLSRGAKNGDA